MGSHLATRGAASMTLNEPKRAIGFLEQFATLNKKWSEIELEDELYEPLKNTSSSEAGTGRQ